MPAIQAELESPKKPKKPKKKLTRESISGIVRGVMLNVARGPKKVSQKKENLLERFRQNSGDDAFYLAHVEEMNEVLQEEFENLAEKYGGVNFSLTIIPSSGEHLRFTNLLKQGAFTTKDARVWVQQIETFAEMIYWAVREPWRSQVVIGSTQLGKTMIMILALVQEAVMAAKTGIPYKAIYLAPNSVSLAEDAENDFADFMAFYDFVVEFPNTEPMKFSDYRKAVRLTEDETGDMPIFRRATGSIKEEIKQLMDDCHAEGKKLILIVDECHWGSNDTGVMAEILKEARGLSARQMAKKEPGDIMIAISATPFNLGSLACLRRIFCRTYAGYIGYAFYDGQLLDPRWTPIYPEVLSFDSPLLASRFNTADFKHVSRSLYLNEDSFYTELKKKDRRGELKEFGVFFAEWTWEEYKTFCEDKLIELIENCLIHNNELDANGFIVRFFHKKDDVIDFLKRRQNDFHPSIKCVAWQGEDARKRLSVLLRANGISNQDLKVVFVTGTGRMGSRLDDADRIYYGADFAPQSNLTAVLQGLLGRMTGAKSVAPIMFLEEKRVEELEIYVQSKGKHFKRKPLHRTFLDVGQFFQGKSVELWVEPPANGKGITFASLGQSHLADFLEEWTKTHLRKWVNSKPVSNTPPKLTGHVLTEKEKETFWAVFNDAFPELEQELKIPPGSFVRYSPDEFQQKPFANDAGDAYDGVIGYRDNTAQSRSNSNKKTTRLKSGTKKEDDKRTLQVQLICRWERSGRTWVGHAMSIQFSLVKHMFGGDVDAIVLPTKKDVGHTLFGEG